MELQARIGQRIRRRREELGMTQQELAGRELTRGFISQLEKGIVMPSLKSLELIASRLYKPVAYFLEESPTDAASDGQLAAMLERALLHLLDNDPQSARELAERAEEAVRSDPQRADDALKTRLEALGGILALCQGAAEDGIRRMESALRALRAGGASRFLALLLAVQGCHLARSGRWTEAIPALEESRRMLADVLAEDVSVARHVDTCLAIAYAYAGRTEQARPWLEGIWQRFVLENRYIMPGEVLLALARCYRAADEPARAREVLERAVGLGRLMGLPLLKAAALEQQAATLQEQGDSHLAVDTLVRAIEIYRQAHQDDQASRLEVELVRLLWQQGRGEEALARARSALEQVSEPGERARLLLLSGQILARLGRLDEARDRLEQAAGVAQEAGLRREFAAACSELGRILRDQGQHDRASEYLARALEVYEKTLH